MNKNLLITILTIIIVILLFFIFTKPKPEVITNSTTTVIPGDTVLHTDTFRPKPKIIVEDPDTIILPADSNCLKAYKELIKKYSMYKYYVDTLKDDSSAFISISETVHNNSIQGYRVLGFMNRKTTSITTITNTTILNNKEWFIGGTVSSDYYSLGLEYKNKNWVFMGGYEFNSKKPVIGIFYKIK